MNGERPPPVYPAEASHTFQIGEGNAPLGWAPRKPLGRPTGVGHGSGGRRALSVSGSRFVQMRDRASVLEGAHAFDALFAPHAGLLHAAEGRAKV